MSRVKKFLFAAILGLGMFGFASPAEAIVIHEEVTIDTDDLDDGLLSVCIGIFAPPSCFVI